MTFNPKYQGKRNKPHFPTGFDFKPDKYDEVPVENRYPAPVFQKQHPDVARNKGWNALLRISALLVSLLGMYISAQFSVDGFSFQVSERAWVGWGIACILVVIESVWQKFGNNKTLFVLAMVCYAYGIITNVVGILVNRGGYNGDPLSLAVPVIFGLLLEVFPEPVLAWAISGDTSSDPIGKMMEKASETEFVGHVYGIKDEYKNRIGK